MPQQTSVRLSTFLLRELEAIRPEWKTQPRFLEDLLAEQLDIKSRLAEPRSPQAGNDSEGRSPFNSSLNKRNKENDFSLQAEEAHVPVKAVKTIRTKPTFDIAQNLWGHEDLIRAYWKAKPKNKTAPAWKLLMTELTKIQDGYGDAALRTQLELAEANRWQGITLSNYERFGLPKGNAPAQGGVDWAEVDRLTFGGAA
jgi:predicted GTPase